MRDPVLVSCSSHHCDHPTDRKEDNHPFIYSHFLCAKILLQRAGGLPFGSKVLASTWGASGFPSLQSGLVFTRSYFPCTFLHVLFCHLTKLVEIPLLPTEMLSSIVGRLKSILSRPAFFLRTRSVLYAKGFALPFCKVFSHRV